MSCRIELSNYYGAYLAGSTIIGKVVCEFSDREDFRGINVRLKGFEKVKWNRGKTHYLKKKIFLLEERLLASAGHLGQGRFEYPFSFTLPQNIPTSFTGEYGWVKYSLKAVVDKFLQFDHKNKLIFYVIFPLDLNKIVDRNLLSPGTYEAENTVSCCLFNGGNIIMDIRLEKKAFVPGEIIKVFVTVTNNSNQSIEYIQVKFRIFVKSTISGWLDNPTKEEKKEIAEIRENGCSANSERCYEILLELPTIDAVPNFFNMELLSFRSDLKVIAGLPFFHTNLTKKIPTTLADIPINQQEEYFRRLNHGGATAAAIKLMGL